MTGGSALQAEQVWKIANCQRPALGQMVLGWNPCNGFELVYLASRPDGRGYAYYWREFPLPDDKPNDISLWTELPDSMALADELGRTTIRVPVTQATVCDHYTKAVRTDGVTE